MPKTNLSRRAFVKIAGATVLSASLPLSLLAQNKPKELMLYIGTYTSGKSEGIYLYRLDMATGALKPVGVTKGISNPSFLTVDPQRKYLYAVNEVTEFGGKPTGAVSAFAINKKNGELTFLNQLPSLGGAPCHIIVDKAGKNVLVANYVGGNAAVFPIQADGKLGPHSDMVQHEGSGPNKQRQDKPHAHNVVLDATNRFAFVTDLGLDQIKVYRFDAAKGKLMPNTPPAVQAQPGAGPRHLTFHPNGKFAYSIHELNSTMTALAYDAAKGTMKPLQTLSTLPKDFSGESYCADVHVSPNGKFLYGSNRGHNSIVVYAIDEKTGKLTYVENVSTQGNWPRNFGIDPTGTFLLAANERSNDIFTFRIDAKTGKLKYTGLKAEVPAPICLQFVPAFG
jgi:6-phosphogluconolactonase